MIIDVHVHAFPHQGTSAGYKDVQTHLMIQQSKVKLKDKKQVQIGEVMGSVRKTIEAKRKNQ